MLDQLSHFFTSNVSSFSYICVGGNNKKRNEESDL